VSCRRESILRRWRHPLLGMTPKAQISVDQENDAVRLGVSCARRRILLCAGGVLRFACAQGKGMTAKAA